MPQKARRNDFKDAGFVEIALVLGANALELLGDRGFDWIAVFVQPVIHHGVGLRLGELPEGFKLWQRLATGLRLRGKRVLEREPGDLRIYSLTGKITGCGRTPRRSWLAFIAARISSGVAEVSALRISSGEGGVHSRANCPGGCSLIIDLTPLTKGIIPGFVMDFQRLTRFLRGQHARRCALRHLVVIKRGMVGFCG